MSTEKELIKTFTYRINYDEITLRFVPLDFFVFIGGEKGYTLTCYETSLETDKSAQLSERNAAGRYRVRGVAILCTGSARGDQPQQQAGDRLCGDRRPRRT